MAVLLMFVALSTFLAQRYEHFYMQDKVTGKVALDLEPVDHIEASAGSLKGYNVVVITTDTTRADHIGCYGNRGVRTPVLDSLAQEGILCAHATTPSPSTLPAHSSLMTGLYPFHHGARANGTFRLNEEVTTLAERLKSIGYSTGAAISSFVLDSRYGLDQGFDLYHDDLTKGMKYSRNMFRERAAELTNEPATQFLRENADGPFFLWVHYFDPHAVYLPPEPFRSEYAHNLYDGEIAYADSQIGVLLDQLEELGVRDRTLVVYASDHGEGLGEHGEQTHSMLVYDATLHVPLILNAASGLPKGQIIDRQTCLIDVVPTVLHLLGEEVPDELDGTNLCQTPTEPLRPVLIETISTMTMHGWAPLLGIRRDDFKYILAPTPELYDLQADPLELENLHHAQPQVVKEFAGRLASWLGEDPYLAAKQAVDLNSLQADDEAMRHLAALGYVKTSSADEQEPQEWLDPKEQVYHWEKVQQAINIGAEGDPLTAISMLERCLAEVPGDVYARSILASDYLQVGELDRALVNLEQAIADEPRNEHLYMSMANVYMRQGKLAEAEAQVDAALEIDPEAAQAYMIRGQIALQRGHEQQALQLYEKAREMDAGDAGASYYNAVGMLHLVRGRFDEARDAFQNAIRVDSLNGQAHDGLANILIHEGKKEEAKRELQIALKFDPNQARALATLASMISQEGDQEQALAIAQRALKVAPTYAPIYNNLGLIYRRMDKLDLAEENYQKAIEYDPLLSEAFVNLAQLYQRQGKHEEAIEQFRLAVEATPYYPNAIALANLGVHHYNLKEPRVALKYYLRALSSNPDYALVHRYVASIYALPEFNQPELVLFHLKRTLELDPKQEGAQELRRLLEEAERTMGGVTDDATSEASPPEN